VTTGSSDARRTPAEGADLPAKLQSEQADPAWLIADMFGPFSQLDPGRKRFPFDFADLQEVSGFERPEEVFEAMGRLDHRDAKAVLAMIGKHANDKTTAKAPGGRIQGVHPPLS
jgi:hypothetical protein